MLIRKFITFLLILNSVPSFSQGNNNDTLQGSKLKDAIVEKKLDKPVNIVNKRYTRGLFSNMMNVVALDFITKPPPNVGIPIMDYLQGKIPGLRISPSPFGGYDLKSSRVNTFTDDAGIKLFLDEQQTDADFLAFLYPKDIALVKYFPPGGALISGGASSSGLLIIYTRKDEDLNYYNVKGDPKAKYKKSNMNLIMDSLNNLKIDSVKG